MDPETPSWAELIRAAFNGFQNRVAELRTRQPAIQATLRHWSDEALPVLGSLNKTALQIRDAYLEGTPETWRMLEGTEMVGVVRLMESTGWCLTIAPPTSMLRALLTSPDGMAREAILLADEPAVLRQLDRALRSFDLSTVAPVQHAAREAWDAHAPGLFMASQALSATALTALLEPGGPVNFKSMTSGRDRLGRLNIEDAGMRDIRFYAVAGAVARAFASTNRDLTPPRLFNRHRSAHFIDVQQYSKLNSLTSLMLLSGFLFETLALSRPDADPSEPPSPASPDDH